MVTNIRFAAGLVLLVCIPLGDGHCQERSYNKAGTQTSTADQKRFEELTAGDCRQIFLDPCTQDWQDQWFLDGKKATITSSETGMDFLAGPTALDDSCHAVLWTKQSFRGDLKIEYEYTRLDTALRYVNILYVQATGSGKEDFKKDILQWSQFRMVPAMRKYFDHMNTYHISYAAFGMQNDDAQQDYIRARRYLPEAKKGLTNTEIAPDYFRTGLFQPNVPHQITVIKQRTDLYMHIGSETQEMLCHWKNESLPLIEEGRVGLRHMYTRGARYKNFRVSLLPEKLGQSDEVTAPPNAE
jgi:hypothetical protein